MELEDIRPWHVIAVGALLLTVAVLLGPAGKVSWNMVLFGYAAAVGVWFLDKDSGEEGTCGWMRCHR